MSWSIGRDTHWGRDIGYSVPAYCDHPSCKKKIDRGLSYVCGGEPHGGEHGCGLYFCEEHRKYGEDHPLCERCAKGEPPFAQKPEHPEWIRWKETDGSWAQWRKEHPDAIDAMKLQLVIFEM